MVPSPLKWACALISGTHTGTRMLVMKRSSRDATDLVMKKRKGLLQVLHYSSLKQRMILKNSGFCAFHRL